MCYLCCCYWPLSSVIILALDFFLYNLWNSVLRSFSSILLKIVCLHHFLPRHQFSGFVVDVSLSFSLLLLLLLSLYSLESFFTPALADGFSQECDNRPPQLSRILLSILAHLNNAVVWMVSTCFFLFPSFQSPYHSFRDYSKCTNYNWHHRHLHSP